MREVRPWLVCCLALLPVLGAYANAPTVGFMWDDQILIQQNVQIHTLHAPWEYLTRVFWQHAFMYGEGHAFYRPLVNFSFALDWQLWGGAPTGFHVVNLVLHLLVCALVFSLAVSRGANVWSAGACTALFGVMPRLTESVTWVVGRTDLLAALFVLSALRLQPAGTEGRAGWRSVGAAVLVLLGLLSKEVAIVGALILAFALQFFTQHHFFGVKIAVHFIECSLFFVDLFLPSCSNIIKLFLCCFVFRHPVEDEAGIDNCIFLRIYGGRKQ